MMILALRSCAESRPFAEADWELPTHCATANPTASNNAAAPNSTAPILARRGRPTPSPDEKGAAPARRCPARHATKQAAHRTAATSTPTSKPWLSAPPTDHPAATSSARQRIQRPPIDPVPNHPAACRPAVPGVAVRGEPPLVEVAARVRVIASAASTSRSPHCARIPAWHRVAVRDPTDSRGPGDPRANLSLVLGATPASGGWMCMPTEVLPAMAGLAPGNCRRRGWTCRHALAGADGRGRWWPDEVRVVPAAGTCVEDADGEGCRVTRRVRWPG